MINLEDRQQLHELIILDFAVRTMLYDYRYLEQLKIKELYIPIHNALLKNIRTDYFKLKREFKRKQISIVSWSRVDKYFSDIRIATAGNDQILRYANQALKAEVEKLLIKKSKKL